MCDLLEQLSSYQPEFGNRHLFILWKIYMFPMERFELKQSFPCVSAAQRWAIANQEAKKTPKNKLIVSVSGAKCFCKAWEIITVSKDRPRNQGDQSGRVPNASVWPKCPYLKENNKKPSVTLMDYLTTSISYLTATVSHLLVSARSLITLMCYLMASVFYLAAQNIISSPSQSVTLWPQCINYSAWDFLTWPLVVFSASVFYLWPLHYLTYTVYTGIYKYKYHLMPSASVCYLMASIDHRP